MRHAPVCAALVAGVCLAIAACSGSSQPAQTRQADIEAEYRLTGTIKDIMDSIVDPSADVIWESVAEILTAAGAKDDATRRRSSIPLTGSSSPRARR